MLARVVLAGVLVTADSVTELAHIVRATGAAGELADRLERALDDEVKLLALTTTSGRSSSTSSTTRPTDSPNCAASS